MNGHHCQNCQSIETLDLPDNVVQTNFLATIHEEFFIFI